MAEHEHYHYDDNAIVNAETHHEKSDVNIRALGLFFVIVVLFAVVTHFMLVGMFHGFRTMENRANTLPAMSDIPPAAGANVPVEPRLQPFPAVDAHGVTALPTAMTPPKDMDRMRHDQDERLASSGTDPKTGETHIPIDEAKRLLLQRGFPVVAAPPASALAASGTAAPEGSVPVAPQAAITTTNATETVGYHP